MDENWLVLTDDANIYLWDCHTHKIHWICSVPDGTKLYKVVRILGGVYYNGICPPLLMKRSAHHTHRYYLAVNGELNELPLQQPEPPYQIDENLILLHSKYSIDHYDTFFNF